MKLIWIYGGARAGQMLQLPDADAAQAIRESWGADVKTARLPRARRGAHAMADAYFAARPGYSIRELRAGKPPALPPSEGPTPPLPLIDMPPAAKKPSGETTPTKAMAASTKTKTKKR